MAQRQIIVDDLDGTEGATVLRFGLDGNDFEIDLAEKNMAEYRRVLERLAQAARKVPASRRGRSAGTTAGNRSGSSQKEREENAKIRAWWRDRGGQISDRGMIPDSVRTIYAEEQAAGQKPADGAQSGSTAPGEGQETRKPGNGRQRGAQPTKDEPAA